MLKKITLTNFRRHEALMVDFTQGLNVVRALNEGGKSTMLEAIAYALYGSRVLRTPMAEAVTWGKAERELKVELVVEVEGKPYTFVRHKGGAEVINGDGVFVTGQVEVTNFAAQLIGADATTANILMFSNQGSLRGALDQGPKATAVVIEQLADFDLFDRLLDAASTKLSLGAATVFEERLKGLKAQLQNLVLPQAPDEAAYKAERESIMRQVADLEASLPELKANVEAATKAWKAEYDKRSSRINLEADIGRLTEQQDAATAKLKADWYLTTPSTKQLEAELASLKAKVEDERNFAKRLVAYNTFKGFAQLPTPYPMPVEDTEAMLAKAQQMVADYRTEIATAKGEIKTLEARKVTSSTCNFCHQDVSQFPEVAKINSEIAAAVQAKVNEIGTMEAGLEKAKATLDDMRSLLDAQARVVAMASKLNGYVELGNAVTPNALLWKGEVPVDGPRPDYETPMKECQDKLNEMAAARARAKVYEATVAECEAKVKTLRTQIEALQVASDEAFGELEQDYIDKGAALSHVQPKVDALRSTVVMMDAEFTAAQTAWSHAKVTQAQLGRDIEQVEADVETLAFNNALVKKIRATRPVVANKLWSLVLTTVSTLFSQMRGEKSVVARAEGGFTVNGQAVEALSGSTLDILGLAIRVSLIKTFLPNCPFLVLDEPAAAMDKDREALTLGFLHSSGFAQILLVTHSDLSDSIADNLIEL